MIYLPNCQIYPSLAVWTWALSGSLKRPGVVIITTADLLCPGAESFRMPRQAEEEKTDLLTKITDRIKSCYDDIPGKNFRLKAE